MNHIVIDEVYRRQSPTNIISVKQLDSRAIYFAYTQLRIHYFTVAHCIFIQTDIARHETKLKYLKCT